MSKRVLWRSLPLAIAASAAICSVAAGQANCALRDPDRQIREFFPQSTGYKTLDARVDGQRRQIVEQKLGSALELTDVGAHTAYLVLKDKVPVGIVHARTEKGRGRGSLELVWALDLDLTLTDFRVQRSREPHHRVIEADAFRQKLVGRDLASLRELMTRGNDQVDVAALDVPPAAATISHMVVLCALKTIVITGHAFDDALMPGRLLGHVHAAFPETTDVKRERLDASALSAVAASLGSAAEQFDAASLVVLRAVGPSAETLGMLVFARWLGHPDHPETWWVVSPAGVIKKATVVGEVGQAVKARFAALQGKDLQALSSSGATSGPGRCGQEVLALLASRGVGG